MRRKKPNYEIVRNFSNLNLSSGNILILQGILSIPSMKHFWLSLTLITFFVASLQGQSVNNLDKTARSYSGKSTGNSGKTYSSSGSSGYSGSGSGDNGGCGLDGIFFLFKTFVYLAQGIGELGKEEIRLAERNRTENNLFYLEANGQGGYGFTDFTKIQAQGRLHLGWATFDLKQTLLNDKSTEFKTLEFMTWFNLVNRPTFKLRTGLGNLSLQNTGDSYFLYGAGIEVLPSEKLRFELWGNLTQRFTGTEIRPRQEINFRCYYDFWKKGYAKASAFAGASSQKYYRDYNFTTLDAGVNFMLSFHRFPTDK